METVFPNPHRIGVIGAGISGMNCAYRLQTELPNVKVTVVSEEFTPNLTSDGSGGFWKPYDSFGTDPTRIKEWSDATYLYLKKLALSSEAYQAGVCCLSAIVLNAAFTEIPHLLQIAENQKRLTRQEAEMKHPKAVDGYSFSTFTCEPKIYLPWITKKFVNAGGTIKQRKVTDLSEFCEEYDLVINCTGLKADDLAGDTQMVPVKGQVIKVKGVNILKASVMIVPGISECYTLPGRDVTTLGGTFDEGVYNTDIDYKEKKRIMDGCCMMEPSLKNCTVEADWCGLRPSRKGGVRLEVDSTYHPTVKVIHNYGHGGIGVTLCWGCAGDVVRKASDCLNVPIKVKSKL